MKVTLSKEDIETIIKEYFGMDSVAWQKDGTIVLDTTLEKITNEKNNLEKFNDKLGINKQNVPYIGGSSWPRVTPQWTGITAKASSRTGLLSKLKKSPPVKI